MVCAHFLEAAVNRGLCGVDVPAVGLKEGRLISFIAKIGIYSARLGVL